MTLDRRRVLMLGTVSLAALVGAGAGGVTSCSTTTNWIKTITDFIAAVQQGVVDGIKKACNTVTAFVPTLDTIMAVAAKVLSVAVTDANLADAVKNIQQIVDNIVAAGCPTPAPAPSPTAKLGDIAIRFY